MGEIVNLNAARKARNREDARATASANRAKHGRTKAERHRERIEAERSSRAVDGARLDRPGEDAPDGASAGPPTEG